MGPKIKILSLYEILIRVVKTENIHKSFNDLEVLKGIDLHVKKGEIVSLVGASGAGKSTLLHLIGTLDKPNKGMLEINGRNMLKLNEDEMSSFRNKSIGFVFQFHHLLPEFTALENVCIPGFIAGDSKKEVRKHARELLEYLSLGNRLEHKPSELSGGEQQRVAVARALMNNPAVILADEPSGNLDSVSAIELHQLFFDLREKFEQTFIIVTHNEVLANMADRKLTIKDGIIQ